MWAERLSRHRFSRGTFGSLPSSSLVLLASECLNPSVKSEFRFLNHCPQGQRSVISRNRSQHLATLSQSSVAWVRPQSFQFDGRVPLRLLGPTIHAGLGLFADVACRVSGENREHRQARRLAWLPGVLEFRQRSFVAV
jgi:hypothetical protein